MKPGDKVKSDLDRTNELFAFLQGEMPEGISIKKRHQPKLTADQAWSVIWYLGNQYWQVTDHVDRCCVCGDLYDSYSDGDCLDYGKAPYHFCGSCTETDAWLKKARRNPNKEERPSD